MTPQQRNREAVLSSLAATREAASAAGRAEFTTLRASDQAAELMARMDVARMHKDKAAFLQAQAELKQLVASLPA